MVREDKFLFGKRNDSKSWYAGVWDIFGGFANTGENPFQTLKRELYEELGISPEKYELFAAVDLFDKDTDSKIIYYVYFVTDWAGQPEIRDPEHSEIKWFSRAELDSLQLASAEYLQLIDTWSKGRSMDNIL